MHDLVIRNGLLVDGSGGEPVAGDLAVDGSTISAVGRVASRGRQELDASGRIVTPGFVDAHTHYDGQVTWDPFLQPSTCHGVTTVVMGNCGVGFAPCKPDQRSWLIGLMEGVEDIPGTALHEGIDWRWESFPEYLDTLAACPLALDVGAYVPHGAVRAYVMGDRGPAHEPATPAEIAAMADLVGRAVAAGAVGFSTSRTEKHRDNKGVTTPSITAHEDELVGIASALRGTHGVLQGISDFYDFDAEFHLFRRMAEASGRTVSITVEQQDARPDWWRQLLDGISAAQAEGLDLRGQVPPRATGILLGLEISLNPFTLHPSFHAVAKAPLADKLRALRDAGFRERLLAEQPVDIGNPLLTEIISRFDKMFRLGEPANYEPTPDQSIAAEAARRGIQPEAVALELLLENDGKALIYHPLFNYQPGNLDLVAEMLRHPHTISGLSDGGAHCGAICDASFPTTLLQHWGRDRPSGRLPLEQLVRMQTRATAELVGFTDRGLLAPGLKADINIINFDQLTLHAPTVVHDLPAGGRRLVQRASGYDTTLVSGQVAFRDGEPTGVLAGQLVRGG